MIAEGPPTAQGPSGVLVDTNILVLYVVGTLDPDLIGKHKRTNKFLPADYRLLDGLLRRFRRIVTTPNVLTEVSNLVDQIGGETGPRLQALLGGLIESSFEEHYVQSVETVKTDEFHRIGLTDSSILLLAKEDLLVLTDDIHLYLALVNRGLEAINFDHVRQRYGGLERL
jgi:rRNA-processing protein FCF1